MNCDMKRSISLYSYQDEYYDGKLDLEGCLRETAKTGATGVELLAEQMIKKFPLPIETEEFREQWFGWLEKYHLTHHAMTHFWKTGYLITARCALENRSI